MTFGARVKLNFPLLKLRCMKVRGQRAQRHKDKNTFQDSEGLLTVQMFYRIVIILIIIIMFFLFYYVNDFEITCTVL